MPSTAKTPSRSEPARGLFGDLLEAVASGLDAAAATEESLTADLEALEPSQETERDPSPEPGTTSSAPEKSVEPTAQAQPPPSITIPSRKRPTRSSKADAAEPTMDLSQGGDEDLDEASKSVPKAKEAPRTAQATVNQQLSDDVASLRAEIQSLQANIGVVSSNVEHTQAQIMDVRALVNDATSAASDLRDALSLVRTTVKELTVGQGDIVSWLNRIDKAIQGVTETTAGLQGRVTSHEVTFKEQMHPLLGKLLTFMSSTGRRLDTMESHSTAPPEPPAKRLRLDLGPQPLFDLSALSLPAAQQVQPAAPPAPLVAPPAPIAPPHHPAPPLATQSRPMAGPGPPRPRRRYFIRMGPVEIRGQTAFQAIQAYLKACLNGAVLTGLIRDAHLLAPSFTQILAAVASEDHAIRIVDTWNSTRPASCQHIGCYHSDEQGN